MDDEKLERTINFILENQAQFTIDIQKIQEAHKEAEKRFGTLERVSLNLYNTAVEQGKNIARLSEDVRELREAQSETAEHLNAVILMVEKFLSSQNGSSRKKK